MIRFAIHLSLLLATLIASSVNAGRIPDELFDPIQSKAKEIYADKGVGYAGEDCTWDYLTPDREYFYMNQFKILLVLKKNCFKMNLGQRNFC